MAKSDDNKQLDEAVEEIWAKHREALQYLIANEPQPLKALMGRVREDGSSLAAFLSAAIGEPVELDSEFYPWVRFSFPGLLSTYPGLAAGSREWLASGSQLDIELVDNQSEGAITVCFAVTNEGIDGAGEGFRQEFIRQMNDCSGEGHRVARRVRHYFLQNLMAEQEIGGDGESYSRLKQNLANYLKEHLPVVKRAVERTSLSWVGS